MSSVWMCLQTVLPSTFLMGAKSEQIACASETFIGDCLQFHGSDFLGHEQLRFFDTGNRAAEECLVTDHRDQNLHDVLSARVLQPQHCGLGLRYLHRSLPSGPSQPSC